MLSGAEFPPPPRCTCDLTALTEAWCMLPTNLTNPSPPFPRCTRCIVAW